MLRLNENDVRALNIALEQQYRSFATHDQVIRDFGPAQPLERIRDVEKGHIRVVEWLHTRYAVSLPKYHGRAHIPHFADFAHACAAAIESEREHLLVYRRLIESAREADVLGELRNLERASRDGHLPALHAWARQLRKRPHARAPVKHAPGDMDRARSTDASRDRQLASHEA